MTRQKRHDVTNTQVRRLQTERDSSVTGNKSLVGFVIQNSRESHNAMDTSFIEVIASSNNTKGKHN